ncbi:hypothetical protein NQZ68_004142 [Dissostichus eleginoides]|nr:hypothetical protein NQZ68_004142 [Dissostichus eleginoides]
METGAAFSDTWQIHQRLINVRARSRVYPSSKRDDNMENKETFRECLLQDEELHRRLHHQHDIAISALMMRSCRA